MIFCLLKIFPGTDLESSELEDTGRGGAGGRGRVSWDEVREWHGHIYTTKCKVDSYWEAAA